MRQGSLCPLLVTSRSWTSRTNTQGMGELCSLTPFIWCSGSHLIYMYLLNAFSIQMLSSFPCEVSIKEVAFLPEGLTSAIGHQDTANVLNVPMNRCNVSLKKGDMAYVAQLQGGRLPEGSTKLPEGFSFRFFEVKIK